MLSVKRTQQRYRLICDWACQRIEKLEADAGKQQSEKRILLDTLFEVQAENIMQGEDILRQRDELIKLRGTSGKDFTMSVQAGGKAGHEWTVSEHLRGACSCGQAFLSREQWQFHLAITAAEQAAKPIASSAHFPRITKHDLEVVVEAMDKLREALRVGLPATKAVAPHPEVCVCAECRPHLESNQSVAPAVPPSVDGLEARCALIEELRYQIREAWPAPWSVEMFPLSEKAVAGFAAFIRTRDRELVEKLEGLREEFCAKLGANEPCTTCLLCNALRAVLAARNEGGK